MKRSSTLNITIFTLIFLTSAMAAIFGYRSPGSIENASSAAIAALSIIFGLSAAVSSFLSPAKQDPRKQGPSNDPSLNKLITDRIRSDDDIALMRQVGLHSLTLASVMLGIVFLVSIAAAPCSLVTRLIAAAFSGLTTFCMLATLYLPSLLSALIKRNSYLNGSPD